MIEVQVDSLTSICLKSHTAWIGILPLMGVVGLRGLSWMMLLALLLRPAMWVLNSFSCSFSSWQKMTQCKHQHLKPCAQDDSLMNAGDTNQSILQQVLQTGGSGRAITGVLLLHVVLHLLHLLFCLFNISKELQVQVRLKGRVVFFKEKMSKSKKVSS